MPDRILEHRLDLQPSVARHANDKENITVKKTSNTSGSATGDLHVFNDERNILRSKSSNGLKVNSKNLQKSGGYNNITESKLSISNANKARKITRKPISIFNGDLDIKDTESGNKAYHDSTTLHRSHSQNGAILSRASSAFTSSMGLSSTFNTSLKPARKIKSQLTLGADNDMAEFFKKAKAEEQRQFVPDHTEAIIDVQDNKNIDNKEYNDSIQEITFTDQGDDITSMKRIATERDSPIYQRTHKVSLHALLSSSTESDDIQETTFDYKEENPKEYTSRDLESLMSLKTNEFDSIHPEFKDDEVEIEFVSRNTNGVYDDKLPDIVEESSYQKMSEDLLNNLWNSTTSESMKASEKFQDPLELKNTWNTVGNKDVLELGTDDIIDDNNGILLEFPDEEADEEDENLLVGLMEFYQNKGKNI